MYPAWRQREAEHGTKWRPGRKLGKVWSKIKVAVELVEELAKARGCSVDEAALVWDGSLGTCKSKPGVASMCRIEDRSKLLEKVGL